MKRPMAGCHGTGRRLGQPRYPNSPGPPAVVAPLMAELIRHPQHQFWPDSLSLVDHSGVDASAVRAWLAAARPWG